MVTFTGCTFLLATAITTSKSGGAVKPKKISINNRMIIFWIHIALFRHQALYSCLKTTNT